MTIRSKVVVRFGLAMEFLNVASWQNYCWQHVASVIHDLSNEVMLTKLTMVQVCGLLTTCGHLLQTNLYKHQIYYMAAVLVLLLVVVFVAVLPVVVPPIIMVSFFRLSFRSLSLAALILA